MSLPSIQHLLWALPVCLAVHVTEEFGYPGGFVSWMQRHNARRVKGTRYYVSLNAGGILAGCLLALTVSGAIGFAAFFWYVAFLATNGLSHVIAAAQAKRYCPGSVTGVLLFWPLLIASAMRLLADGLSNWPTLALTAASGLAVGLLFLPVHGRR